MTFMNDAVTRIKTDLTVAMRMRDRTTMAVLRDVLAVIDNAQARDASEASGGISSSQVAGASLGAGSSDVDRRELSDADVYNLISAERDERMRVAGDFDSMGRTEQAARLRQEASVLAAYL